MPEGRCKATNLILEQRERAGLDLEGVGHAVKGQHAVAGHTADAHAVIWAVLAVPQAVDAASAVREMGWKQT